MRRPSSPAVSKEDAMIVIHKMYAAIFGVVLGWGLSSPSSCSASTTKMVTMKKIIMVSATASHTEPKKFSPFSGSSTKGIATRPPTAPPSMSMAITKPTYRLR